MSEPQKPGQKPNEENEVKKTSFLKSPAHLLLLAVVFIILVISGIYLQQHRPAEVTAPVKTDSVSQTLSMTASSQDPQAGEAVQVSVWEDSGDQAVNAVQATINYPTDKFEFVSLDSKGGAFEVQAQGTNDKGKIVIARGHKGNLVGKQLVAKINLKTKNSSGYANLTFGQDTHLVSAETNQDILKQSSDITFNIGN
jgi:hypothetical protein